MSSPSWTGANASCSSADYDKRNLFDIGKFLDHKLRLAPDDEYEVIEGE